MFSLRLQLSCRQSAIIFEDLLHEDPYILQKASLRWNSAGLPRVLNKKGGFLEWAVISIARIHRGIARMQ